MCCTNDVYGFNNELTDRRMRNQFKLIFQWVIPILAIGIVVGSLSAFFLVALEWATELREENFIIVMILPIGGLLIGWTYFYFEHGVEGGSNRLISEMTFPKQSIHWKMTPLVLFGTIATHFFGGSAGREGTAVQMGGATADQLSFLFQWGKRERGILLRMGVAAGFAGVFGTPLAGILFAFEFARDKKVDFYSIPLILATAFLADAVCSGWDVDHTIYQITEFPNVHWTSFSWVLLVGVLFGLAALFFNYAKVFFETLFKRFIHYPPFRPMVGGVVLVVSVYAFGTSKYLGLGMPVIEEAFVLQSDTITFSLKLLLTAFTLGAGFKGGEATPLFFIGATLGSTLFGWIPLPLSFLAGLGFIAVFSGSTNTPIACVLLGCELFGYDGLPFYTLVCFTAYLVSGKTSAYKSQVANLRKYSAVQRVMRWLRG